MLRCTRNMLPVLQAIEIGVIELDLGAASLVGNLERRAVPSRRPTTVADPILRLNFRLNLGLAGIVSVETIAVVASVKSTAIRDSAESARNG